MSAPANEPLRLKKRKLSPKQRRLHNFVAGDWAEQQAKHFLKQRGFSILDQNIRVKNHEIDVVAFDETNHELVFVEVKSRFGGHQIDPWSAVDRAKLRSIQYVAAYYRRQIGYQGDFRFDIITVVNSQVRHYQNVTWNWR